jgi:PAS domain S-box-containing protein
LGCFGLTKRHWQTEETILRLSRVFAQNPFTTIITSVNGLIQYTNEKSVEMTGYEQEELLGENMSILSSGVYNDGFYEGLWKRLLDKEVWQGTFVNRRKDGELRDCKSTIFPVLDKNNEILNFVTIQEDITEKNIQDKLFLMQTRQAQMGEMLSMIAHQWRQPLSIISTITTKERVNITLGKNSIEQNIKAYDAIELQIKYLSSTISDFSDFFKPDKEAKLTKGSILVNKAADLLEHDLDKKGEKFELIINQDPQFETFEHEVEQVILNLFKNAEDALLEKKVRDPQITIIIDIEGNQSKVTFMDNGYGIDDEILETLFLPYVSTKDEQNGTGLGLYMSKTIIEEHCQGSLTVCNSDEGGACFVILLPLKGKYE